jgi:hypothetical protein
MKKAAAIAFVMSAMPFLDIASPAKADIADTAVYAPTAAQAVYASFLRAPALSPKDQLFLSLLNPKQIDQVKQYITIAANQSADAACALFRNAVTYDKASKTKAAYNSSKSNPAWVLCDESYKAVMENGSDANKEVLTIRDRANALGKAAMEAVDAARTNMKPALREAEKDAAASPEPTPAP